MKKIIIIIIIIIPILTILSILTIKHLKTPEHIFDDLDQELDYIISDFMNKNKSIKNCIISVMKGDGSFSWTGSKGIASYENQVPMTDDTPICIASVTKIYTAIAIMQLYEKGFLSLDDTMSKYLPDELIEGIHIYNGKDYSYEITIKQLLSHTSGIADYYLEKPKAGKNFFELFLEYPEKSWTVDDTIKRAREELKPNFIPGTKASYSDTNFQLLGKIIESITNKPLHVIYDEYFFRPLNLNHSWLINYSRPHSDISINPADIFYKNEIISNVRYNRAYWADGGIVSTAEECIIFLKALNDGKLISKKTLELMHKWNKLEFP